MKNKLIKSVNKEELKKMEYYKSDVLFNQLEKDKRKLKLQRAYNMGTGLNARKSKIIFACKEGIHKVEAKVISLSRDRVILKGRSSLPLKSIIGLEVAKSASL